MARVPMLSEQEYDDLIHATSFEPRAPRAPAFNKQRDKIYAWYRMEWLQRMREERARKLNAKTPLNRETVHALRNEYDALTYALEMLKPMSALPSRAGPHRRHS